MLIQVITGTVTPGTPSWAVMSSGGGERVGLTFGTLIGGGDPDRSRPGVVATGDTEDECAESMREAIAFHIEGLIRHGYPVPPPGNSTRTVHVDAA